jgi:ribose transport system ATP-binding protein
MSRSPESPGKSAALERVPIKPRAVPTTGAPALSVSGLGTSRKLSDIAFEIKAGEIVGLAGLVGSGRSTLAKAIFGLIPDATGAISVAGRAVQTGSVSSAVAARIGFVPEDRRLEGLVANRSLAENFALTNLDNLSYAHGFGPMATHRIAALFARYRSDLSLLCRGPSQAAQELSGGNQQKVVFAKWLATNPKLLILDEPTSGVDINAKRDMRELIKQLAARGVGVLLISSELEELIELCDRILVMAEGRITRSLERIDDEASLRALLQTDAARQTELRNKEKAA